MPFLLRNLLLSPGDHESLLPAAVASRYKIAPGLVTNFRIVRKGIDARKKSNIRLVFTVEFSVPDAAQFRAAHAGDPELSWFEPEHATVFRSLHSSNRIVIAGMGPAGLFAALRLSEHGLSARIIERGKPMAERVKDVAAFWNKGILDPVSNVQFGEGGAGTFSDGKLTTRVRDLNMRYVLEKLVAFGAPPEILYSAKPHIGTDRLRGVVTAIRGHLEECGFTVGFEQQLTDLELVAGRIRAIVVNCQEEYPCDILVLAPGHSARDTYEMLLQRGVALEQKPFAIGVRVEHPQELINRIQYGNGYHPELPAADYSLAWNNHVTGRSAYSFCMCPGGVVVASSSETGGVVTNGMSGYRRNAPFANSALVVTVGANDFPDGGPLAGVRFQRIWESKAFVAGGGDYRAPAQNLLSFLDGRERTMVSSSYRPGVTGVDLNTVLPRYVGATLREGLHHFDRKMRGFVTAEAALIGVETRTSAPVRIKRGDDLQSTSARGFYPAGEGAGYAGGIMSAALDGIRVADAIVKELEG
jgi:uncharacterized FAD-dependent dehydrogenase